MKDLCRNSFLVDLGIDVKHSKQIAELQKRNAFSEECYRFLLAQSNTLLTNSENALNFFDLESDDSAYNLIEVNDDSIFSPYVFFFARRGKHHLIGEITSAPYKGYIVSLDEEQFCDVDSLEELLEDCDVCVDTILGDEAAVIQTLLSPSVGIMTIVSESFTSFK